MKSSREELDAGDEIDDDDAAEPVSRARAEPSRKKRKQRQHIRRYERPQKWWTTGQLLLTLSIGLAIGVVAGYAARGGGAQQNPAQESQAAQNTTAVPAEQGPIPSAAPAGATDKFGRAPGDPHYGHDHASQPGAAPGAQPSAAPAAIGPDGKDSFGRAPGQEHFGHNHP